MIHRVAQSHNYKTLSKILSSDFEEGCLEYLINKCDKQGNSPLILCSIVPNKPLSEAKIKCIRLLINSGAYLNCLNKFTNCTSLHWVALNGERDCIEELLKFGAYPFIPNINGIYPIDQASHSNNEATIRVIIRETMKYIIKLSYKNEFEFNEHLKLNTSNEADLQTEHRSAESKSDGQLKSIIYFLFNPVLHTKMLYYAIKFNASTTVIHSILKHTTALANGPVIEENENSPLHAACIANNKEGLKILLENLYNDEYDVPLSKYGNIDKVNQICSKFDTEWNKLMKIKKYHKINTIYAKFMKIVKTN